MAHRNTPAHASTDDDRYRVLAESAPDAIVTIDEHSTILSANHATERIFGWNAEELIGRPLTMLMPERMRAKHQAGMARYLRSGTRKLDWRAIPLPALTKDGREFPIEVSFGELVEDGRHIFSGIMRDVSERETQRLLLEKTTADLERALADLEVRVREAEEARNVADAANAAKAEFLRTMSHELRTPLNAIGGFVELLELGVHGPVSEEQQADLERIRSAQARLLSLINDILSFAKLEQGEIRYDIRAVPLEDVLCATRAMVEPQLRAKQITFECDERSANGMQICADPDKLEQILLNLLSNALKFTPKGGRIEVRASASDGMVRITVRDTGPGIPRDHLKAVFEPFVQVDSTLTRTHEGTGLGLSISRELAQAMGGMLTVESEEGTGAAFTLSLPAA